jgi:hypothetical protein
MRSASETGRCEPLRALDRGSLAQVSGGEDPDPRGQITWVGGKFNKAMTCGQVDAAGRALIARADDRSISDADWMSQWRALDDAFLRFPKPC